MLKLLISWNIRAGREDEYFKFVVQSFGPGLVKLGIQPTDSWYTAYGDHRQILTAGIAEDSESLERALTSDEWRELKKKLLTYVTDYSQKIVRASERFQL